MFVMHKTLSGSMRFAAEGLGSMTTSEHIENYIEKTGRGKLYLRSEMLLGVLALYGCVTDTK